MSTKSSIKWNDETADAPGYHLYEDVMDGLDGGEAPIYLELNGVHVELLTLERGMASVTVTLPRAIATDLGLLNPTSTTTKPRSR